MATTGQVYIYSTAKCSYLFTGSCEQGWCYVKLKNRYILSQWDLSLPCNFKAAKKKNVGGETGSGINKGTIIRPDRVVL